VSRVGDGMSELNHRQSKLNVAGLGYLTTLRHLCLWYLELHPECPKSPMSSAVGKLMANFVLSWSIH
jgi:hypothetical protein